MSFITRLKALRNDLEAKRIDSKEKALDNIRKERIEAERRAKVIKTEQYERARLQKARGTIRQGLRNPVAVKIATNLKAKLKESQAKNKSIFAAQNNQGPYWLTGNKKKGDNKPYWLK